MIQGVWIGCAGWTLPRESVAGFPGSGTHLERYGRVSRKKATPQTHEGPGGQ